MEGKKRVLFYDRVVLHEIQDFRVKISFEKLSHVLKYPYVWVSLKSESFNNLLKSCKLSMDSLKSVQLPYKFTKIVPFFLYLEDHDEKYWIRPHFLLQEKDCVFGWNKIANK